MIRHEKMGKDVYAAAWQFPLLSVEANIQPITRTVLKVSLDIFADFRCVATVDKGFRKLNDELILCVA